MRKSGEGKRSHVTQKMERRLLGRRLLRRQGDTGKGVERNNKINLRTPG